MALALALPVAVALAEATVDEPVALAPAAVLHETTVGTETPWAWQIWVANTMAEDWSSASQAPVRQQAMLPRKDWFSQMHLGSVPQPA